MENYGFGCFALSAVHKHSFSVGSNESAVALSDVDEVHNELVFNGKGWLRLQEVLPYDEQYNCCYDKSREQFQRFFFPCGAFLFPFFCEFAKVLFLLRGEFVFLSCGFDEAFRVFELLCHDLSPPFRGGLP